MNSVTRTSVFSRSRSSRRRSSCVSRNEGPSSRRCTPFLPTGAFRVASVREMFWATASWSTSDFLPFLRFFPFSRRRSSSGGAPGAADATGRGGFGGGAAPAPGTAVTSRDRLGHGLDGLRGAAPLGRRRGLLLLALVALPARAHQRHLLVLERREMTAHEDVHLLEHAHQLLAGDSELRC